MVDVTYVKLKGVWRYFYRVANRDVDTIDFYLSPIWNAKAV
ncbi:DDE-type integrase/transposase/recombinase [Gluconobacter sp. OJB]